MTILYTAVLDYYYDDYKRSESSSVVVGVFDDKLTAYKACMTHEHRENTQHLDLTYTENLKLDNIEYAFNKYRENTEHLDLTYTENLKLELDNNYTKYAFNKYTDILNKIIALTEITNDFDFKKTIILYEEAREIVIGEPEFTGLYGTGYRINITEITLNKDEIKARMDKQKVDKEKVIAESRTKIV
jgi:hypothetical protein